MSLGDIVQKIISDAQTSASQDIKNAHKAAKIIADDAEKDTQLVLENMDIEAEKKIQKMFHNIQNLLVSEKKSGELLLKRSLLNEAFQKSEEQLTSLSQEKKTEIFAYFLSQIPVSSGTLHPVQRDRDILNALLQKNKSDAFSLGDDIDGKSGFVFVSDSVEMDFRFEVLLQNDVLPEAEQDASRVLFSA